jgi:hypothetical protein
MACRHLSSTGNGSHENDLVTVFDLKVNEEHEVVPDDGVGTDAGITLGEAVVEALAVARLEDLQKVTDRFSLNIDDIIRDLFRGPARSISLSGDA